ncbi:MAG: hypothetical protein Q8P51_18465 [Ignavibacteria bacterium]|nr:hypothetical protein [Ignavibacteria bacterium]
MFHRCDLLSDYSTLEVDYRSQIEAKVFSRRWWSVLYSNDDYAPRLIIVRYRNQDFGAYHWGNISIDANLTQFRAKCKPRYAKLHNECAAPLSASTD